MADFDHDVLAETLANSLMSMADAEATVAEANRIDVPIKLLKRVVKFIARIGPDQDVAKRALAITVLLVGEVDHDELLPLIRCIETRMQALARLQTEPAFGAWSLNTSRTGTEAIDELLVEVAAGQPLTVCDGRPAFESGRFFEAVFEQANAQVTA